MTAFVLSKDCPTDATLSYEDGRPAYIVESNGKLIGKTTVISRADGEELAKLRWRALHEHEVEIGGNEMKLSGLMPKKSTFSSDRLFKNSSGEEFRWKMRSSKVQCTSVASDSDIATYHSSCMGIIGKKHPAYIDIADQGLKDQDLIVITCLIMAALQQDQTNASAAAMSSASSNVAAISS
ncbi:hypothetical protein RhiJN_19711 [Ceratobasidium sp. AG-Ba]|nr:hypothetical protein RhiJN_04881 [Ceratobasidium sp. AG-Ba]QRV91693.1 hypothetical protein RhiJN_19711 [Ceratobasidium sp. AG-Ba]